MTYLNARKTLLLAPTKPPKAHPNDRLYCLLHLLGDPHQKMRYIRIAGSNAKSVCGTMLESILAVSEHNVGFLVVSDLENPRRAIRINGVEISEEDITTTMSQVRASVNLMKKRACTAKNVLTNGGMLSADHASIPASLLENEASFDLTGSEFLLFIALLIFRKYGCQFCIIECDDHAYDPSLILPSPLAAVISGTIPTSKPHELEAIKRYIKSGIMEIVSAPQNGEAYKMISDACAAAHCRLSVPARSTIQVTRATLHETHFSYRGRDYRLSICGNFQILNAVTVMEAVRMLRRCGIPVSNEAEREGLEKARIPARFEFISYEPYILVDSAYKADSLKTVCDAIAELCDFTDKEVILCLPPDLHFMRDCVQTFHEHNIEIKSVFSLLPQEYKDNECSCESLNYPTISKLTRALLSEMKHNSFIFVCGHNSFSLPMRYELLRQMGY